jgi:hypothetical protein
MVPVSVRSQLVRNQLIYCFADAADGRIREAYAKRPASCILLQLKCIHRGIVPIYTWAGRASTNGSTAHDARPRILLQEFTTLLAAHLGGTRCAKVTAFRQNIATRGAMLELLMIAHTGLRLLFAKSVSKLPQSLIIWSGAGEPVFLLKELSAQLSGRFLSSFGAARA